MELVNRLDSEIISAMKEKNTVKLNTLRGVKAAMKQANIDKKIEISDELLIDVVSKEIKTRCESIKEFEKGGRDDLVSKTKEEISYIETYLPEQLSDSELNSIIDKVFSEVNPTGMSDMGKVMGIITPLVKGKADMGKVSGIIRSKLG